MAKKPVEVESLTHDATRKNIPTAEFESLMHEREKTPIQKAYARRNPDLDPQLVWRGKDMGDWSDLIVQAPPLYIQEKVHPRVLIDDLRRQSKARAEAAAPAAQADMFADFNGLPDDMEAKTEFYAHDQHWSNRMISGDSLSVMASLAEREGLRGRVQCIYFDPPYGIKFNSNFQWSTTSRDVKDGDRGHITREPEQVRAFRDTWRDGIHSYLTYLRDRLTVARDLLSESGSIFVQIGDENVHRVRALMDEVFGDENCVSQIAFQTTTGRANTNLASASNYILWFAKNSKSLKFREPLQPKEAGASTEQVYKMAMLPDGVSRRLSGGLRDASLRPNERVFRPDNITSSRPAGDGDLRQFNHQGRNFPPGKGTFKSDENGLKRLKKAGRIWVAKNSVQYVRFLDDFDAIPISNVWTDTQTGNFTEDKVYVVQTAQKVIARCILMTTDPGDLVLDPTCGSGTTAYVAEQWGRRWITIDTSRVAVALARSRLMGARYPYYLLADSPEGQQKEAEVTRVAPRTTPTYGSVRQGFVYERVPHITLKSIANNAEIDVIWDRMQPAVEAAIADLNRALGGHPAPFKVETGGRAGAKIDFTSEGEVKLPSGEMAPANGLMEWEIPREAPAGWPFTAQESLARFWQARIARQKEIDASIAAKAEFERLGRVPVLKARMNPDLHMGADLKSTGAGNLFVIFGEPDIRIEEDGDMLTVQVFGVDVFKPQTGSVESEGTEGIALWMLDTDYNEESFFVRHAYFLGANDPYKALKTSLKAEIDEEAWESLYSDTSRPFPKPKSGRIAVKVINHLGDEVMKVFAV